MSKIKFGLKAEDKITGFSGIVTGHAKYITGCDQYCIVPKAKDGEPSEGQWFDEGRIEIIGRGITEKEVKASKNGGPQRDQAPIK